MKRIKSQQNTSVVALSLIGYFCATGSSFAQSTSSDTTVSGGGDVHLEEIVVTARRREEKIQTVPISITAVTQQTLQDNNIATIGDLQRLVPSMTTSNIFSRDSVNVALRGQGANIYGGRPGVITYLDEVPIPGRSELAGGPGLLFDLENVQVLKGPQGTLFGRNTVGGALLLQTARPKDEFGGRVQLGYGNYNNREVDAAVDLPIVREKLLARVAFNGDKRDGFTHLLADPAHPNGVDVDDRNYWSARVTVVFRPSDRFQNDFIATYQEYDHHGSPWLISALNPDPDPAECGVGGVCLPVASADFATAAQQQLAIGPRTIPGLSASPRSRGSYLALNNITRFDLTDNLTVRNILGYGYARSAATLDLDATAVPIFDFSIDNVMLPLKQLTEEAQLLGKSFGQALDWTFGVFYLDQPALDLISDRSSVFGITYPPGPVTRNSESSKAVYAQGTYDLSGWASGLKFTAGARYTRDKFFSESPSVITQGEFSATTWTLGLDYQASPDTLVYLASRRGYRPGGSNGFDSFGVLRPDYDAEYVTDFELGLKSDWHVAGMPVRTNVAVYYQDYSDIQVQQVSRDANNAQQSLVANAAGARLWGVELEAEANVTPDLQLGLNFDYLKFKATEFGPGVDPVQLVLGKTYNRPPYKYGVKALYRLPINPERGDFSLQANWNWQATSGDPLLLVGAEVPSYGVLNFSANWNKVAGGPIDASLYVSNALDKVYSLGGYGSYRIYGFSAVRYGEPRMYGLRLRYRFGAQ